MDISEWLTSFFNRSSLLEKIVIIIAGIFIVGLLLYVGKNGVASWN